MRARLGHRRPRRGAGRQLRAHRARARRREVRRQRSSVSPISPSRMAPQASELYAHDRVRRSLELVVEGRQASRSTTKTRCSAARSSCTRARSPGRRRSRRVRARARRRRRVPTGTPKTRRAPPTVAVAAAHRACMLGAAAARRCSALFGSPSLLEHLTVFVLACFVGWHVIWNVTPALHTPLMSVTNAISGIILIGGLLLGRGRDLPATTSARRRRRAVAAINVAGGFLVTAAHAEDVPEAAVTMMPDDRTDRRLSRRRHALHPELRGLSTQETRARGNLFGIIGMALAVVVSVVGALRRSRSARPRARPTTCSSSTARALVVGGLVGAVARRRVADDGDARARRGAPQLRRSRRGARRHRARSPRSRRAAIDDARTTSRSSARRLRRRGHVHRLDRSRSCKLRGTHRQQAAAPARPPRPQPRALVARRARARRARLRRGRRSSALHCLLGDDRRSRRCSACTS